MQSWRTIIYLRYFFKFKWQVQFFPTLQIVLCLLFFICLKVHYVPLGNCILIRRKRSSLTDFPLFFIYNKTNNKKSCPYWYCPSAGAIKGFIKLYKVWRFSSSEKKNIIFRCFITKSGWNPFQNSHSVACRLNYNESKLFFFLLWTQLEPPQEPHAAAAAKRKSPPK